MREGCERGARDGGREVNQGERAEKLADSASGRSMVDRTIVWHCACKSSGGPNLHEIYGIPFAGAPTAASSFV